MEGFGNLSDALTGNRLPSGGIGTTARTPGKGSWPRTVSLRVRTTFD